MTARATCLIADSLDDLLQDAFRTIIDVGEKVTPTKGPNSELRGVTLQLTNPRSRISRSESRGRVFSALAELLWYLSGSEATEHITHYLPAYSEYDVGGIVLGAYGPRLRGGEEQLATVIALLRDNPSSRRAVIQIYDREDLFRPHKNVPCTCTLQFLCRAEALDLVVTMRSNDAYLGLPHDAFCFSMIQELVARAIGVELGQYIHFAGSLHLYDRDLEAAQRFLDEGYYSPTAMPRMPESSDPMAAAGEILAFEQQSRSGVDPLAIPTPSDPYWADLARLLAVFELVRKGRVDDVAFVLSQMTTDVYRLYVEDHLDRRAGDR